MLEITSLRVDRRKTEGDGSFWLKDIPFAIVNICFRVTDDEHLLELAKAEASEYSRVLTITSPEKYEAALANWDLTFKNGYDFVRAWTIKDPVFLYLEKFQTFHFREWIADTLPTKMMLWELQYYKENGKLPSVYRHTDECIILQHLRSLRGYWD
jgi:hypothetical protein